MDTELISTTPMLEAFLDCLEGCEGLPPSLYVDLEGNNLSRRGTISLITILLEPQDKVYLIDLVQLKTAAFITAGANGRTLKNVLESKHIIKVFFDIRNDSDALFSLYGIRVGGIEDLQLMELASRSGAKRVVNGLARCIEWDSNLSSHEVLDWKGVKDAGRKLYDPNRGGSYEVFEKRPLSSAMMKYCCQDVTLMPQLRSVYRRRLCDAWWQKIGEETDARIALSHSANFNGQGRHMAESPRGWMHWRPTEAQKLSRTLVGPEPARSRIPKCQTREASDIESSPDASQDILESMRKLGVKEE